MSGAFGSSQWAYSSGVAGYQIDDSLRFDDGSSAYLNRTPSTASNRKTWTFSAWVKRANLGINTRILGTSYTSSSEFYLRFKSDNTLEYGSYEGGGASNNFQVITTQVFRDVSAWYHIVFRWDTTQSTAANRLRIYVNGEQITAFSTANYPSQNYDGIWNNTVNEHRIGYGSSGEPFDGYMAELNLIDGTSLEPDSFGETVDGYWRPVAYSGSYGTNGFYLDFDGNTNDASGNSNDWTANNISAHDYVPDSPTNNFAVLNNLVPNLATYSEGNLKITTSSNWESGGQSIPVSSGKWYAEFIASSTSALIGVEDFDAVNTWSILYFGSTANGVGYWNAYGGQLYKNNSFSSYAGGSYGSTDIVGVHLDMDNKYVYFSINGIMQNSGNPASGSSGTGGEALSGTIYVMGGGNYTGNLLANFGQDSSFAGAKTAQGNTDANGKGDFYYSPSSGYLALCTANLPEPTIIDASTAFNTVLYTGTGATQSITGFGFGSAPDFVWLKNRSLSAAHILQDSVRGSDANGLIGLSSSSTLVEATLDTTWHNSFGKMDSLDADGFTVTDGTSSGNYNTSGNSYVAWAWDAGSGSAVSNTNGSITSTVKANPNYGFSVTSWTTSGTTHTVGHGLSLAPEIIFTKARNAAYNWDVYHFTATPNGSNRLILNSSGAVDANDPYANVSPTNSVFSFSGTFYGSGKNSIAYCFHSVEGFSKVGNFLGNGNADGPFVYTGFRPAFILTKANVNGAYWVMHDSERDTYNVSDKYVWANLSNAEGSTYSKFDFLSNGFKCRNANDNVNYSGTIVYYIAFAETPFKYANAR